MRFLAPLRRPLFALAVACTVLFAATASADTLRLVTDTGLEWNDVAHRIVRGEIVPSTTFRVRAIDSHGENVACAEYRVHTTDAGSRAMTIGACDMSNGYTTITFAPPTASSSTAPSGSPPPLDIPSSDLLVTASDVSSAASSVPLECSADVRPVQVGYSVHGSESYRPGRYLLRVTPNVVVTEQGDHWHLREQTIDPGAIGYDVVDRSTGERAMRGAVTPECTPLSPADAASFRENERRREAYRERHAAMHVQAERLLLVGAIGDTLTVSLALGAFFVVGLPGNNPTEIGLWGLAIFGPPFVAFTTITIWGVVLQRESDRPYSEPPARASSLRLRSITAAPIASGGAAVMATFDF